MPAQSSAVLVLRVWTEQGAPEVRARIIEASDVFSAWHQTVTAAGVDGICDAVRTWLEPIAEAAAEVTEA